MLAVATPVARRMANHHRRLFTLPSEVRSGLYLTGGLGVEPPAKISDPLLLLKRGIDFLCTYALARSSTSIATIRPPPLMKFDKYSPGYGSGVL